MNAKKKHNRVLKLAKGYRGARSKQYRVAKQSVMRALASSYAGRKEKKRQFRQLWIARINAAARLNGLSYSKFMYGLKLAEVDINRKMLAEMAVNDAEGFKALAELAKGSINVRFIELMPIGQGKEKHTLKETDVKQILCETYGTIKPVAEKLGSGPAHYIEIDGFEYLQELLKCRCL